MKTIQTGNNPVTIDDATSKKTSGKTGSVCVKGSDGKQYQYKPPIADNSLTRRVKADSTDSENFGEVLAARIAKALDIEPNTPRVPTVSFVTDKKSPHVAIASQYLTGNDGAIIQSLDDYLGRPSEKSHIKLVVFGLQNKNKGYHNIDDKPELKKELARAVALSALVGDHDVNPGNMIVITEANESIRLGRIDFGHAFNDLRRSPSWGGQKVHNNNMIDFFNRATVDGLDAKGQKSKLWRDYPGLIPSRDMADALRVLAKTENGNQKITDAIDTVHNEVTKLVNTKHINTKQIIRSFQRIAEHVSGDKIDPTRGDQLKIEIIFSKLKAYATKNLRQMEYAADVMTLQVDIQDAVRADKADSELNALKDRYDALVLEGNTKSNLGPFVWIKETEKTPPFHGDFNAFVEHRRLAEACNNLANEIDSFLVSNEPNNEREAHFARDLKAIAINPKTSPEEKLSLLIDKTTQFHDDSETKSSWLAKLITLIHNLFFKTTSPQIQSSVIASPDLSEPQPLGGGKFQTAPLTNGSDTLSETITKTQEHEQEQKPPQQLTDIIDKFKKYKLKYKAELNDENEQSETQETKKNPLSRGC